MTLPAPTSLAAAKAAPSTASSASSSSSSATHVTSLPVGSSDHQPDSPGPTSPRSRSHYVQVPQQAQSSGGPQQPRGRLVSRACDRCRRRKAKCEYINTVDSCTHCRDAHVQCTFDLPLARRGPKARKRSDAAALHNRESTLPALRGLTPQPQPPPLPPLSAPGPGPGPGPAPNVAPRPITHSSNTHHNHPNHLSPVSPEAMAMDEISSSSMLNLNGSLSSSSSHMSTRQRWLNLSQAVSLRNTTLERMVRRSIDLFFEYLYPLTPLVYEPAIRDVITHIFSSTLLQLSSESSPAAAAAADTPSTVSDAARSTASTHGSSRLIPWSDSTFILVTAVCAEASFMLPKDIFPEGESVADCFLQASRDGLHTHLESDLESPTANSIAIRYFHSNCLHAVGKPGYSWHIFGEAIRLAQVMQLHDESSMKKLSPIEAELRRRCFWILYLGDKSAAILNNRPVTIHKYCFDTGISTLYPSGIEEDDDDDDDDEDRRRRRRRRYRHHDPRSFIAGFNANVRLWQFASDLLLEIRVLQDQANQGFRMTISSDHILTPAERHGLDSLYVRFITCLDDLPPHLQSFHAASSSPEAKQFVIQTTNLQVTLHCLRMVIEQKFEDLAYYAPGVEHADLRKSEIVRDMLRVMNEAPFWALQANGEPNVEKIRLIGASLLAIIHRNQDSPLATRARGDFSVLLDILTRLDSKASDALRSTSNTFS